VSTSVRACLLSCACRDVFACSVHLQFTFRHTAIFQHMICRFVLLELIQRQPASVTLRFRLALGPFLVCPCVLCLQCVALLSSALPPSLCVCLSCWQARRILTTRVEHGRPPPAVVREGSQPQQAQQHQEPAAAAHSERLRAASACMRLNAS
jgi:hypothetical protein